MSATSLAGAKTDLYNLLATDANGTPHSSLTSVTKVYKGEPKPGEMASPCSVTIATRGVDPAMMDYVFELRIYVDARSIPAQTTQDTLDAAIDQVDARTRSTAEFGPSMWDVAWAEDLTTLVARSTITAGREDDF